MGFGKPRRVDSGITDYRKSTPGLRISRPLLFFKTQVILVNVKGSKKGLPECGILYMFNPSNTSGMDLEALHLWGHGCIGSFPIPNDLYTGDFIQR